MHALYTAYLDALLAGGLRGPFVAYRHSGACWGPEPSRGGATGIGSAGGATAGFGDSLFGWIGICPEEGAGARPGALSAGGGSGFLCGRAAFGGV